MDSDEDDEVALDYAAKRQKRFTFQRFAQRVAEVRLLGFALAAIMDFEVWSACVRGDVNVIVPLCLALPRCLRPFEATPDIQQVQETASLRR